VPHISLKWLPSRVSSAILSVLFIALSPAYRQGISFYTCRTAMLVLKVMLYMAAAFTGWTKLEAVESLVRKSGYQGRVDESLMKRITLTRYQSSKVGMEYKQYVETKHMRASPTVPKNVPVTSSTTGRCKVAAPTCLARPHTQRG
jgi:hypothetical protein